MSHPIAPRARVIGVALGIVVALAGCDGPFAVFPGGAIGGEATPAPARWSPDGSHGLAQLETRGAEGPYSVNIAYTIESGVLYVNAGDTETQFAGHQLRNKREYNSAWANWAMDAPNPALQSCRGSCLYSFPA